MVLSQLTAQMPYCLGFYHLQFARDFSWCFTLLVGWFVCEASSLCASHVFGDQLPLSTMLDFFSVRRSFESDRKPVKFGDVGRRVHEATSRCHKATKMYQTVGTYIKLNLTILNL